MYEAEMVKVSLDDEADRLTPISARCGLYVVHQTSPRGRGWQVTHEPSGLALPVVLKHPELAFGLASRMSREAGSAGAGADFGPGKPFKGVGLIEEAFRLALLPDDEPSQDIEESAYDMTAHEVQQKLKSLGINPKTCVADILESVRKELD